MKRNKVFMDSKQLWRGSQTSSFHFPRSSDTTSTHTHTFSYSVSLESVDYSGLRFSATVFMHGLWTTISMQYRLIHFTMAMRLFFISACVLCGLYSSRLIYLISLFMCWRFAAASAAPFKSGLILSTPHERRENIKCIYRNSYLPSFFSAAAAALFAWHTGETWVFISCDVLLHPQHTFICEREMSASQHWAKRHTNSWNGEKKEKRKIALSVDGRYYYMQ